MPSGHFNTEGKSSGSVEDRVRRAKEHRAHGSWGTGRRYRSGERKYGIESAALGTGIVDAVEGDS
jgi:hypothetical protein